MLNTLFKMENKEIKKKDWFGRKEENSYTTLNKHKKLIDWEEDDYYSNGSRYSSYFYKEKSNLSDAASIVGSMIKVISPTRFKMTSHANAGLRNQIPIPISILKEGKSWSNDLTKLDAFYGSSIQNAALATMQSASEYKKTIESNDIEKIKSAKDYLFSLINTERIGEKITDRFPGYGNFLRKFKDYQFDNYNSSINSSSPNHLKLLELITKYIRYPKDISEEDYNEFSKPLDIIEKEIKKYNGVPNNFFDCDKLSSSIYKTILEYIEEEEPKDEEPQPEDGEGDGSGGSGESQSEKAISELTDFSKLLTEAFGSTVNDTSESTEDAVSKMAEDYNSQESLKNSNHDSQNVKFVIADENSERYLEDSKKINKTKAKVLSTLFLRKNKDYKFSIKAMRSGQLDTSKIAEAVQNVPTVYERYGEVKTDKLCIGVILDESGSMAQYDNYEDCISRIERARQAAIFLNEIFKSQPDVELFIYGHTADYKNSGSTDIFVYKEPNTNIHKHALGSAKARSNNRDGVAIYEIAKRIRKNTSRKGIIFVLSDGQPAASNYAHGVEDTRLKVLKSEKLGFQVIQIAISRDVDSAKMFSKYIKIDDIAELPTKLTNYVSRKVDKLIKENVTVS